MDQTSKLIQEGVWNCLNSLHPGRPCQAEHVEGADCRAGLQGQHAEDHQDHLWVCLHDLCWCVFQIIECDKIFTSVTCQTCPGVQSRTTRWGSWPPRPWWRSSPLRSRRWSVSPWSPCLIGFLIWPTVWSKSIITDHQGLQFAWNWTAQENPSALTEICVFANVCLCWGSLESSSPLSKRTLFHFWDFWSCDPTTSALLPSV